MISPHPLPSRWQNQTISSPDRTRWSVAVWLVMIVLAGCNQQQETALPSKPPVSMTNVSGGSWVIERTGFPNVVRTQGSLWADEVTTVGARVPGQVLEVLVELGDVVEQGQALVRLDPQPYQLQVDQAEAQLLQARSAVGLKPQDPVEKLTPENAPPVREANAIWNEAKSAVERLRKLSQSDAISATDLEVAEAAERVAEARYASSLNNVREKMATIGVQTAQLGIARQRLKETETVAPFRGIVRERMAAPGSFVTAGQQLVAVVRNHPLRFRASVPERYAHQLAVGQRVHLDLDLGHQPREVKVTRISPVIDPATRSLLFEAEVDNQDGSLPTGLFAEAQVVLDEQVPSLVLPAESIVRFAGVDKVWKIVDGKVQEQPVQLGRRIEDRWEVLAGISEGDRLLKRAIDGKPGIYQATTNEAPPEAVTQKPATP
ncbi:MAG: efflux RND transporter periplasmic adaptor subunit [Pirellulaceae bacterium]|jgi:RND family efflux transporter MFP subunit